MSPQAKGAVTWLVEYDNACQPNELRRSQIKSDLKKRKICRYEFWPLS
jgi:hypothetical protein